MLETLLFYLISTAVVAFSLGVILARSAVYSVLCLVAALCGMAGLFILLKAFLVATILVLVYAGAILVLFLFVVMLVDFQSVTETWSFKLSPLAAVALAALFFMQILSVIRRIEAPAGQAVHGTAQTIGRLLFSRYVLPFEMTSFLLLVAVVSVVVLAKRDAS